MITAALASIGINFVKDLIVENGEELVKQGIKKVTNIDLNKKEPKQLTPEEVQLIKDSEFKIKNLDFEKLKEENRHEEAKYNKSHETYQLKNDMSDTIAKQIISRNLPIIGILVIINVILVYFMQDHASLIAIASNIIGVTIGNLFAERQAIVNFFFGSSIGSKEKDNLLRDKK